MIDNSAAWIKRADEIIRDRNRMNEAVPFATSMLTALYGPESPQFKAFFVGLEMGSRLSTSMGSANLEHWRFACGTIANAKAELENGLIVKLRTVVAGEMLTELLQLGKEKLAEKSEAANNVAAVLVAASFEDMTRRMAAEFLSLIERPKLEEVVGLLKTAAILKGGEATTALSFLKFRNDSLHADWANVSRAQVESCVSFLEALIVKHFS